MMPYDEDDEHGDNYEKDTNTLTKLFDKFDDEYLKFDRIKKVDRKHEREDLCAMLYLHEKLGGSGDAVCAAEHDEIYLDWAGDDLLKLTEEDVLYLVRCGVRYSEEHNCLCMFA